MDTHALQPAVPIAPPLPSLDGVRALIREQLSTKLATLEDTAARLQLTPRTLQRRLRDHGTSFHDLREAIRCEMACAILRSRSVKLSAVAAELQYLDESAFVRAFKRWTCTTPGAFRAAARAAAATATAA